MCNARTRVVLGLITSALIFVGCGGDDNNGDSGGAADGGGVRVALLTPGPISDRAYNLAASQGLDQAQEEYGVETALAESTTPDKALQRMRQFAQDGYNIIIGHGFEFGEPAAQLAPEFPETKFIIHNSNVEGENVQSNVPAFAENAYLAGIVAGRMINNGRLATVAFAPLPSIIKTTEGVREGALSVNKNTTLGCVFIQDLIDLDKAREAARSLLDQGAELVFPVTNGNGVAVIEEAAGDNKATIGYALDQTDIAPEAVLVNQTFNYPRMMDIEIGRVLDDEFAPGIEEFGLADGVVDIEGFNPDVPEDVVTEVEDKKEEIIDGDFEVPVIEEPQGECA